MAPNGQSRSSIFLLSFGTIGAEMLQWSGTSKKKSGALWSGLGFAFLTAVEVMDGYSAEWGASSGDNRHCWNSFVCFTIDLAGTAHYTQIFISYYKICQF
jgi:hypothetical protein